jgi:MFS family permease
MSTLNQQKRGLAMDKGYPIRALLALTATVLLVSYVETMILPGVPIIQKDLSTTATIASWITSIVLLVGAIVSPLFGKFGDLYGKKKIIIITLAFYTAGVAIAGFSTSIYFLLFARAIQGVGVAMIPLALALLTDVFPKEQLAAAQGTIAGSAAISMALGLVLGSYVVQDFGWQMAFHSAAILSVILLVIVVAVLKRDTVGSTHAEVDYRGAFVFALGIALILLYFTEGSTLGWLSAEVLAFLISGLALTVLFFVLESKVAEPLIQLRLLRVRNVLIANLITIVTGVVNFLAFFAFIYYAESPMPFGLGFDALTTGLTLAPATVVMFIVGIIAGRIVSKTGPKRILFTGATVSILGFVLFEVNRAMPIAVMVDIMVAFAGIVALVVPVVNMISVSLPKESISVGQGLNATLNQIGGAIGPVLTTTIIATYTKQLTSLVNGKTVIVAVFSSATAFNIIFAVAIAFSTICMLLTLTIRNDAFKKEKGKQPTEPKP